MPALVLVDSVELAWAAVAMSDVVVSDVSVIADTDEDGVICAVDKCVVVRATIEVAGVFECVVVEAVTDVMLEAVVTGAAVVVTGVVPTVMESVA